MNYEGAVSELLNVDGALLPLWTLPAACCWLVTALLALIWKSLPQVTPK